MNFPTPHGFPPRPHRLLAALTALLVALLLGLASPALAAGNGNGPGNGNGAGDGAVHGNGPDHSRGNASTTGSSQAPQPLSTADQNTGGANGQCPGGAYCSTRDGSASQNGRGDTTGNAQAKGKPCAGCVGKADNKNPHGQRPNGSDHNAGYECDRNQGIGQSNPAHTGCAAGTTSGSTTPPPSGSTSTPPTSGGTTSPPTCTGPMPGHSANSGTCTPPTTGGTTSPPTCTGPMPGHSANSGTCTPPTTGGTTSAPFIPAIAAIPHAGALVTSAPVTQAPQAADTAASETVAPRTSNVAAAASTGVLPNTGAPAHVLLILLGALAMLGCGALVVRRQRT